MSETSAAVHPLSGLIPLLHRLARLRWLLCPVGAVEAYAQIRPGTGQPYDLIRFSEAGGWIVTGRLGDVYATSFMQGGPLELLASWALFPFPHQHEAGYAAVGQQGQIWLRLVTGAALVAVCMLGARRLRTLHRLPRSQPLELLAGLTAVLLAVPYYFWAEGHLSQFAVPVMWVAGASLAVRGRTTAAGLVIGLSAGWQSWGVLAAGLLLVDRRPGPLLRAVAAFVVGALSCYLPFVVTGRFEMFALAWPVRQLTLVHTLLPQLTEFGWPYRFLQGLVAGLAGVAVALVLGRRRDLVWLGPLAVVTARLLLDPVLLPNYWYPLLVLAVAGVSLLHPGCSPWRLGLVALLCCVPHVQNRYVQDLGVTTIGVTSALITALLVVLRREEPADA
ncbi:hypothetical protein KIH74_01300 [Kineosporia sp. J2-2]|uniref:DUF2029 domain-containing protein n=1 Tax=Kineosporia corallincola TaxID=2835133 RepID=A0ABS5T8Y6_9ACTN|nr:hypothetical protein [Kineosporia corallincola]MBT0767539.1 hypothetical protein [Kineosporia corallincola]